MKELKKGGTRKFVVDIGLDKLQEVLQQAQSIGLMSDYDSYLITNMVIIAIINNY